MIKSYKSSGVDILKANSFVNKIKPYVKKTFTKNVLSGLGNFGALYEIPKKGFTNPVFISSVDGVGTKVKIAAVMKKFDTVGEDLINHCVNDIAVCGATPLFFLDYYATGKLNLKNSVDIVKGLVKGCRLNGLSLIGGETAEMPGVYDAGDFDLAGAIVGIADKSKLVDFRNVRKTDVLIGFKSNGLHTNGYSLVRNIFSLKDYNTYYNELKNTLGKELLKTHRSYLKIIQYSLKRYNIKSFAHITGGGIAGNTVRVIPDGLTLQINWDAWKRPDIFKLIQNTGNVSEEDMRRTFNLGIGLIAIVSNKDVKGYLNYLSKIKEKAFIIGKVK